MWFIEPQAEIEVLDCAEEEEEHGEEGPEDADAVLNTWMEDGELVVRYDRGVKRWKKCCGGQIMCKRSVPALLKCRDASVESNVTIAMGVMIHEKIIQLNMIVSFQTPVLPNHFNFNRNIHIHVASAQPWISSTYKTDGFPTIRCAVSSPSFLSTTGYSSPSYTGNSPIPSGT